MTFLEAVAEMAQGKKVIRGIWREPVSLRAWYISDGIICNSQVEYIAPSLLDYQANDWEIYKEPAPEPTEKTLGEFVANVIGCEPNPKNQFQIAEWKRRAQEIESEVLRRYHESLPKIEGKTAGQVLLEIRSNNCLRWEDVLPHDKESNEVLAARFLAAYQLAPSKPEPETAIDRLFNSGFEKPKLWIRLGGSYQADFNAFGRGWVGYGDTPEQAAAVAIDQFKNFIAGK